MPRVVAAPAADMVARKSRRHCMSCIKGILCVSSMPERLRRPAALLTPSARAELVEEAPVGALGEDLRGAGLDHADLVQPQRVEPHRILRVELAPARVRQLGQRLERIVVALGEPEIDQPLRGRSGSVAQMSAALRMARRKRLVATG